MACQLEMNQVELVPTSTVVVDTRQWKLLCPKLQCIKLLKNFEERHFCGDTLHPAHRAGHCPKKRESQGTGNLAMVDKRVNSLCTDSWLV